ncbi:MAG: hypothetical protein WC379_03475 [Methanoregula sp.]|jgi:hypothetical protein
MDFTQAEQQRQQLSARLAQGQITPAAYTAAINAIRVTDSSGRWWQPNPQGAGWLYWDGKTWITGTPPAAGTKGPGQDLMSFDEFRKISKEVPLAKRPQRWWDLLSILGGVAGAALWFVYGGLREGFDVISAVLMIVMPAILVIFRPGIDEILLPIQPTRKQFHRVLLIGLGIASPFLTAWILYNIFHISQYPLMQANIVIGTLVSYALVRDPAPGTGAQKSRKPSAATGVSIIFCILVLSALAVPVMADDCTRDPLNAQDCLRTNGYAEVMAGLTAAILAGLINGPTILQTFLQQAATSANPAAQSIINQTVLSGDLQNLITKLAGEGKYVSNATLIQKGWYNFPVKAQISDWATGSERLHCEEAAKYGEELLKTLQAQFGKDVRMGQIFIERNPLMNHTANVVQLPNGEKFIVDVWRSLIDGKPAIYNQADWVKVWNAELGGSPTVDVSMF